MENLLSVLLPYLFYVIGSVLGIVFLWYSKQYIMPWLKQKLDVDTYLSLVEKIKDLMASAENQPDFSESGKGAEKADWVITQLKALGVQFNEEYVRNLIVGFTSQLTAEGIINTKK